MYTNEIVDLQLCNTVPVGRMPSLSQELDIVEKPEMPQVSQHGFKAIGWSQPGVISGEMGILLMRIVSGAVFR